MTAHNLEKGSAIAPVFIYLYIHIFVCIHHYNVVFSIFFSSILLENIPDSLNPKAVQRLTGSAASAMMRAERHLQTMPFLELSAANSPPAKAPSS